MRREFRYTNSKSAYFGQLVEPRKTEIDTMQNVYPYPRKIEGDIGTLTNTSTSWSGRTYQDFIVYRLAETYLLRAEAYFRLNDLENAAKDINGVRKYSIRELTRTSIQDFHQWWPIPQTAIDSNVGAKLEQTVGY